MANWLRITISSTRGRHCTCPPAWWCRHTPTSACLVVVFYAHVNSAGGGVLCLRQLFWWWCFMPTSARLVVVFYAYVSSSGGGVLCLRQLVWWWCFICTSALLMVVPYAHVSSSGGGGDPCLRAWWWCMLFWQHFRTFLVTVRLHVFFGRPHPRLSPTVQPRTVLRSASRDMRPTYWPIFRNPCALTGENPRQSVGGEETTTCCSFWWRTLADAEGLGQRNSSDVFCTLSVRGPSSSSSRLPCYISTDLSVSESYIPQSVRNKTKQNK